jgi:hypothetical protein
MKLRMLGVLIGMLCVSALANANPPSYTITDLGLGIYVTSIGNNNQVLAADLSGDMVLFHPDGSMTDLTILVDDSAICFGPAYNSNPWGTGNNDGTEYILNINDNNFGRADCGLTYQHGVLTVALSDVESELIGVNDSGQIIGWDEPTGFGPNCSFVFLDGTVTPIAINDSAQIVASAAGDVILCTNGNWQVLAPLPGATSYSAIAINKHGYVVGTASVSGHSHGVFWGNGVTRDSGVDIQLSDINAANEIVGNHTTGNLASFVHIAGVTYDLVTLISPTDLLQPYVTFASPSVHINDNGVIAVAGTDSRTGLSHVYLLKPA